MALARAAGELAAPLRLAAADARWLRWLLGELGWYPPSIEALRVAIADRFPLFPAAVTLAELADRLAAGEDVDPDTVLAALDTLAAGIAALDDVGADDVADLVAPMDRPEAWKALAAELPEWLLLFWLGWRAPVAVAVARALGVVETAPREGRDGERARIRWDLVQAAISDPIELARDRYGWGTALAVATLLEDAARVARATGRAAWTLPLDRARALALGAGEGAGSELSFDLLAVSAGHATGRLRGVVAAVPDDGLLALVEASGAVAGEAPLRPGWTLRVAGAADTPGGVGFRVDRGGVRRFGEVDGAVAITVEGRPLPEDGGVWVLAGEPAGSRVTLAGLDARLSLDGDADVSVGVAASGGGLAIVVSPGDADAFVGELLGAADLVVPVPFSLGWSTAEGWTFAIGAGLDLAVGRTFGPVRVDRVRVGVSVGETLTAEATVSGGVKLGPFALALADVGFGVTVTPGDGRGPFGGLAVEAGLRGPSGFGLALDVPGLGAGGGFLHHDEALARYTGAAAFDLFGVGIAALGIVDTGDPRGWSMVLSLSARMPGVPLGFGFTLLGLGGVVAVHRALAPDALRRGLRDGSLDALLFPDDPVGEAPALLAQLDAAFPRAHGAFALGPVFRVGWGTRALFTADVGVIVSLPDPVVVALVGQLEVVAPHADAAVVELRVDVLGVVDLGAGTLSVDAELRDSRVGPYALSGSAAIRASWLHDPAFLLSFGGFHPAFEPPTDLAALRRLRVALDLGDEVDVALEAYLAVTSNTFQAGARLSAEARSGRFVATAAFGFDALVRADPFGFAVDLGAMAEVRWDDTTLAGAWLDVRLSGPEPWHLVGEARVCLLGAEVPFRVEARVGRAQEASPLPAFDLAEAVGDALAEEGALRIAEGGGPVRARPGSTGGDPVGTLELAQRVAPLGVTIEHVGGRPIEGADRIDVPAIRAGGVEIPGTEPLQEWFATAQFFELDDAERLAAPSFERYPAGVRAPADVIEATDGVEAPAGWEVIRVTPKGRTAGERAAGADELARELREGPVAKARALRTSRAAATHTPAAAFVVARRSTAAPDEGAVPGTWADARAARRAAVAADPAARADLVVVAHRPETP